MTSNWLDIYRAWNAFGGQKNLPVRLAHILSDSSHAKMLASAERLAGTLEQIRQEIERTAQLYRVTEEQWRVALRNKPKQQIQQQEIAQQPTVKISR